MRKRYFYVLLITFYGCYNTTTMRVLRWVLFLLLLMGVLLAVRPDDSIAQSFVQRAEQFQASLDYQRAADYWQVALTRQPWNVTARLKLADVLQLQRRYTETEQILAEAEHSGADRAEVERRRAIDAEQQGQWAEAAPHWQNVIALRPSDRTAYTHLIDAYHNTEQWEAARATVDEWIKHVPELPEDRLVLGKALALDDRDQAARLLEAAVPPERARPFRAALDDADPALRALMLGRAYLTDNDLALAQRAFDLALQANPAYAEAYAFAGFVRDERGADGGAWLDQAVALDPNLIAARYFRARHRWTQSDLGAALDDLNYAIARDPGNALIAAELGRVYTQRSDFTNAEKWLTQARDLKPQDVAIWKSLAELYVGRSFGTPDQAVATAQQIVALAPADAEAHLWLGRAYLRSGDRSGAELELKEAVRLDAQAALAHFYLGRLYGQNTEVGRAAYERAATLDPTGPIGAAAQRVLSLP